MSLLLVGDLGALMQGDEDVLRARHDGAVAHFLKGFIEVLRCFQGQDFLLVLVLGGVSTEVFSPVASIDNNGDFTFIDARTRFFSVTRMEGRSRQ